MAKGRIGKSLRAAVSVAALFLLLSRAPSAAQRAEAAGERDAADVVVLLDVSQSVLPYFQDVADYVVGSVIRDYLRFGDTFHLLSFGDAARPEIVERMRDESDVKSALARLYLLYPLARYSDLLGALEYLNQYAADLPESRRKVLVVISDGIHNPPP
ncbi:MAG: VWA domain-containing protein, partial [Spirochaetaceae bacterium]|nr:VWA domain-containing protein [Spirochaetaceae bacterium]